MDERVSTNFRRSEFACRCGCGFSAVDTELLQILERLREHFNGAKVTLNSPCRCSAHNKAIGGSSRSKHVFAIAADFAVNGVHADRVADYLEETYPNKFGIGRYIGRTHVDVRPNKARWDKR